MIVLTVFAAIATMLAPAGDPTPDPTTFYLLQGGDDTIDPVAECLLALGWTGRGDDGMSAIYAPSAVIRNCGGSVGYPIQV